MTTPETPKDPETYEPKEEGLISLQNKIIWDSKKFESLSKDPSLINWLKKVSNKCCEKAFSEQWEHFEKLNVWKTIENILKKYPNLWFEISWNLWLPLSERNFSKLSLQQKLNFTALHSAIFWKNVFYKNNPSSQDIINRIRQNNKANFNKINRQFERKNIKNLLDLEDTLKDFGLTSAEIWKVKEYLLLIKKHPELAWAWIDYTAVPNKAWDTTAYLIISALALILWAVLWALWKHYIDNIWKVEIEKATRIDGVTRIENPEAVLKLVTREANFRTVPWRKVLTPKTDDDLFFQITRKVPLLGPWLEEKYKDAQTREITMELEWRVAMQFDLKKWSQIDIDVKNWKWIVYVQLPYPDIITTKTAAKVKEVDRELVHIKEYEQAQEELRQELEQKAINDAKNNPEFYKEWEIDVANQLYGLLSTVYKPTWLKVSEVHVRFFDPNEWPKDFIDPEGKSTVNFK